MASPTPGRLAVFGIDPHKATHTVVAVDALGRQVTQRTVAARTPPHRELITWARTIADDRVWAVQDCRHGSRRLERDLLAVGSGSCGCRQADGRHSHLDPLGGQVRRD